MDIFITTSTKTTIFTATQLKKHYIILLPRLSDPHCIIKTWKVQCKLRGVAKCYSLMLLCLKINRINIRMKQTKSLPSAALFRCGHLLFTCKTHCGLKLHFRQIDQSEISTEVSLTTPEVMWTLIMKLSYTEVNFYPEVKSQTGLSSLRVSCERALNVCGLLSCYYSGRILICRYQGVMLRNNVKFFCQFFVNFFANN